MKRINCVCGKVVEGEHDDELWEEAQAHASDRDDFRTIERLVALDALPEDWRSYFERKLAETAQRRAGRDGSP